MALTACSQDAVFSHHRLCLHIRPQVWRLKPLRVNAWSRWLFQINGQHFEYHGTFSVNRLGISVLLHRSNHLSGDPHIAAQYTWAGPHRVIYSNQPRWVLTVVRDLYRVVKFPLDVNVSSVNGQSGQMGVARQANGDVTRVYFINNPDLPWRVVVICRGGRRISATFTWTASGRLRSLQMSDPTTKLRLHVRLFQQRMLGVK